MLLKDVQFVKLYAGHIFCETVQPKSIVNKVENHTLNFIEEITQIIASESVKQAVNIMIMQSNISSSI